MWNKKLKRIPAAVLAGILLLLSFSCAWAEDTGRQTIKVAFPTQEGMSFFGHSGKVTGYNYDYLEKISEYTGWVMDYVPYGSDDGNEAVGSALQDLQSGKVDLMGPLLKNAATEKLFEFPENSYGTVYTTLNALSTGSLRESSLHSVEKLRVGLWETAATRAALEYYIYETGSALITSQIPGQVQNIDITVSRSSDPALLAAMNNYIYSISEDDLAAFHPTSVSLMLFMRRNPAQAVLVIVLVTALIAAVIVALLTHSAKQRAKMEATHSRQLREALQIAQDANEAKSTFLSNMSHDACGPAAPPHL